MIGIRRYPNHASPMRCFSSLRLLCLSRRAANRARTKSCSKRSETGSTQQLSSPRTFWSMCRMFLRFAGQNGDRQTGANGPGRMGSCGRDLPIWDWTLASCGSVMAVKCGRALWLACCGKKQNVRWSLLGRRTWSSARQKCSTCGSGSIMFEACVLCDASERSQVFAIAFCAF